MTLRRAGCRGSGDLARLDAQLLAHLDRRRRCCSSTAGRRRGRLESSIRAWRRSQRSSQAAAGQTLVIQQRGLDLSLPGTISLATVLVTKIPNGKNDALLLAIVVTLIAAVAGVINARGHALRHHAARGDPRRERAARGHGAVPDERHVHGRRTAAALHVCAGTHAGHPQHGARGRCILVVAIAAAIRFSVPGRRFVAVGANPSRRTRRASRWRAT
ncbi:MAG: hypothetical protein U0869_06175 [Chloroflexota bacterium]